MEHKIKSLSIIKEVNADIDYLKLRTPTYENRFSRIPRWENNKNDQFICTALFKKEYISSAPSIISRSKENMLPVFFTFESDSLPLLDQIKLCNTVTNDVVKRNYIFSQTFSGSKSIHTLVWIKPEFRDAVSLDFKFYWGYVANVIFESANAKSFDSQCASIGRLSRNPNGIRDNGKKQSCIFYNKDYELYPINLENIIKLHSKVLKNQEIERLIASQKLATAENWNIDDYEKLERIHKSKKEKSESFNVAYEVLIENNCPKGADYIGAASSLKGCGFGDSIIRDMLEKASNAHPSNISPRMVDIIIDKLHRR